MAKLDFYKGNKLLEDTILKNYTQGRYFNTTTHSMEGITAKPNKYNLAFIKEINELNSAFYALTVSFSVAIELLSEHKNEIYGVINNLYRLLRAQGGTIRYNRLLKSKLRMYGIHKQKILDSINREIRVQKDRVTRNKAFLREILKECGLIDVILIVETDTGKDMFTSIVDFIEDKKQNETFLNDEDIDAFYANVKTQYIEFMREIADKHGVDMYKDISKNLLESLEHKRELAIAANQEAKERKQVLKDNKRISLLTSDNVLIQNELEVLSDIVDGTVSSTKIRPSMANTISNEFRNLGCNKVYYIGIIKNTSIRYYKNDESDTSSVCYMTKFKNKELAKSKADKLRADERYIGAIIDVLSLDISCMNPIYVQNIQNNIKLSSRNIKYILETLINTSEEENNIQLLMRAVNKIYGSIYNVNMYKGKFYIYCLPDSNKGKCVLVNRNGKLDLGKPNDADIVIASDRDVIKNATLNIDGNSIKLSILAIEFNCERLKNALADLFKENALLQISVNNKSIAPDLSMNHGCCDKYTYLKLLNFINKYGGRGTLYYISKININKSRYPNSFRHIRYIRRSNKSRDTSSFQFADMFSSRKEAEELCSSLNMLYPTEIHAVSELYMCT